MNKFLLQKKSLNIIKVKKIEYKAKNRYLKN